MKYQEDNSRVYYRFENTDGSDVSDTVLTSEIPDEAESVPAELTSTTFIQKPGFWKRQFGPNVTPMQRRFDWYFGVMLPLACIYFDPFVFRTRMDHALLERVQIFAYVLSSVSIMGMVSWLLWREKLEWLSGVLAGLFFAAAIVSLGVGLILLPFSMIGLIVLLGALGFTPLLTSLIFLRNGVRAARAASPLFERSTLTYVIALTGLVSLVIPYVLNMRAW
jgi:hypothetical protein